VILCDTGPLVALIVENDQHHARCAAALQTLPDQPLVTTWPCFTEAMYLLGRAGGLLAQDELWGFLADGLIQVHACEAAESERMRELMHQYHDTPMDFADASLVTAAEFLGVSQIFTLDSHFHVYRIHGKHSFQVIP
jgi:predicted nucleic acid-binding protein